MSLRLFITIESLGDGSVDRLYRFADGPPPSWDSDNVYIEGLRRFPGSIAPEVDFRNGGASIGGLSFELIATSNIRPLLYSQRRIQIDTLQAALTTGATSITLQQTWLEGYTIIAGHEAIYLDNHVGAGVYDCTRGVLGTQAEPHGVGARDYVSVFDADAGPILRFRRVTFGYVNLDTATGYSNEVTLWAGLLTGISAPAPHIIRVDADGLLSLLSKRTINNQPWRGQQTVQVNRTIIVSENREVVEEIPTGKFEGPGEPLAASGTAKFALDGKAVAQADWTSITGGASVSPIEADLDQATGESGNTDAFVKEAWEVFHCNGTGSTTSLPFSNNWILAALQMLTTTEAGGNGAYDLGKKDLGLGIPASWIDITGAVELANTLAEHAVRDVLYLGMDGKPVKVMEWIQRKGKTNGVALVDDGGTLRFTILEDNSALTTATLTIADIVPPPDAPPPNQQRGMSGAFDKVVVRYHFRPGQGTKTASFEDAIQKFLNRYGDSSQMELDMEGISDESLAESIAIHAVQRWHQEIPQIDLTVLRTRDDIGLGDLVLLTHPLVYQPDNGTRSVTGAACLVTAKRLDLENGTIKLRLLHVGALYNRVGRVAPTAVVEAWTGGTKTLDIKEDYSDGGFQSGVLSTYPRDSSGFTAGDKIALCNRDHSVIESGLEIASVGSTTLVLTTTPSNTPVAGNLIKMASYNQAASQQTDLYAFIADSNEVLGTGDDAGYEWTR